jgi:predicted RNA binding protein YcfA (HicA-like mRNA interferase family)
LGDRGTPRLAADQVIRILQRHGFSEISQKGSHKKFRHAATKKQVIVAQHKGKTLPLGTMRSIIEGSGIPESEWAN